MKSKIELKAIKELLGKMFFIPSYQRGYKWKEKQVEDLLNDLDEFKIKAEKNENPDKFYCLQPLAVKRKSSEKTQQSITIDTSDKTEEEALEEIRKLYNNIEWEVIDGQQRLTTIYLLLCYLGIESENRYSISYETRSGSKDFLKDICNMSDESSKDSKENVDFYHMYEVYKKIKSWFAEIEKRDKDIDIYKENFKKLLLDKVQFIWYETDEDPIKVFTRLNIGKIGLTNSELIKALILSQSNFDEKSVIRQNEIANEWNDIEQSLQNDEFWYFIHEKDYNKPTRIDFLFDVLCELDIENMKKTSKTEHEKKIGTDKYRTFRHYDILLKEKKNNPENQEEFEVQWDRVRSLFEVLTEWYKDVDFYHYIGYILCCGKVNIETLYKEWQSKSSKKDFTEYLKGEIREILKDLNETNVTDVLEQQYEIEVEIINKEKKEKKTVSKTNCKPILLLHNIQTVINQNKQAESEDKFKCPVFYRFPFYLYKTEDWDVEHIDSNTTNDLKDNFSKLLWLLQYENLCVDDEDTSKKYKKLLADIINKLQGDTEIKIIDEDAIKKSIKDKKISFNDFDEVVTEIEKKLGKKIEPLDDNLKNQIGNFTLLDSSTNRGYGNSIFSKKRLAIMAKDRCLKYKLCLKNDENSKKWEFEDNPETDPNNSAFIPPVTRNIFMKYYSPQTTNFSTWDNEDFESYKKDIKNVLEEFLSDNHTNN